MKYFLFSTAALALALLLAGCKAKAASDPAAGAPQPAQVEQEGNADLVKVAHPEQFAIATASKHDSVPAFILYTMFHSFKWAARMLANIAMAPLGGLLELLVTGTHFSVSSGVGFLALFGMFMQTGVIMLEYIDQLRARGHDVADAAVEGAVLRLRPIMMTTLVATLGLLPAALSLGEQKRGRGDSVIGPNLRTLRPALLGPLPVAVLAAVLSGCSRAPANAAPSTLPAATVESVPDRNLITLANAERFPLAQAVARRESDQILANGAVAADVSRSYAVNALSSGRVVDVKARLGDDVQKGQLLLTMNSPDMSQAFADYHKFEAGAALAKSQLDRTQLLYSHGATAQKDLDVAEDTFRKANIDTAQAEEHIRLLGGDPRHASSLIEIHAPVAGTIIEQNVTSAAGVKSLDNSPNLFTIADLSKVWILCDVFENDLARVHLGDRAEIELNAYPNRRLAGRVTNISKLLDANTRAAKVRIELPNETGILRPNMFATIHFVSQGTQTRTVIPSSAVLRQQDRDWVFVKLSGQQFRRTEVLAGPVDADKTQQILSGLHPGDRVVTTALLFDREVQKSTEQ